MNRRRKDRAFTLLELVFVLIILSATLAVTAPSLRGWSKGSKLRDAADEFVAVTRHARAQAVSNGTLYRLQVDALGAHYQLMAQQGQQFVPLGTEWGRVFILPEGHAMTLTSAGGGAMEALEFYPSGRTQPARARIAARDGHAVEIECPTPAEGFRILTGQELIQR